MRLASAPLVAALCSLGCGEGALDPVTPMNQGGGGSAGMQGAGIAGTAGTEPQAGAGRGPQGSAGAEPGAGAPNAGAGGESPMGCDAGLLACDPLADFPPTLLETGLFSAPPDFSQVTTPRVQRYVPDPPLWSDGLFKLRHILLPEGSQIDNSGDTWVFPVGTIFIKTFLDDGPGGTQHPVESRFIRRSDETFYEYFVYQWNEAGTDAMLLDNSGSTRTPVSVTLGGETFTHNIPSQIDCEKCHIANGKVATDTIGFDELRLNSKLEPDSEQTQLEALADLGYFASPLPAEPMQIVDADPTQLEVKRFVFGNCAHCHHGRGVVDFRPDVFIENTLGQPVDSSGVNPPEGFLRVTPQDPDKSVLFLQVRATDLPETLRPMPPVGVQFPPQDAIETIRTWINSLPAQ